MLLPFLKMFWTGNGKVWHGRLDIVLSTNPEITDSSGEDSENTDQSNSGITFFRKRLGLLA